MTICFTGAHGTGKTTLARAILPGVNKLAKDKGLKPFSLIVGTTREAMEVFEDAFEKPVNEATIVGYRLYKMAQTGNNIIIDRGLWDPIAYAGIYNSLDGQTFYLLNQAVFYILRKIPHQIFYLPIAINLIDDGVRSTDLKLQMQVDIEIKAWLNQTKMSYITVESVSLGERITEVLNHLSINLETR